MGGHWNRSGRRSGGNRPVKILAGKKEPPLVSIQCFERRHNNCHGVIGLLPGKCECACHRKAK